MESSNERIAERAGLCLCASINRKGHVAGFYGPPYDLPDDPQPEKPVTQLDVLLFGGPVKPYKASVWSLELSNAFVYDGELATNLNKAIDPASGWHLEQANAINDQGQIIVRANNSWIDERGEWHIPRDEHDYRFSAALLLTPVP